MLSFNDITDKAVAEFDSFPDDANLRIQTLLVLFACSRATLYRHIKSGLIPQPLRFGPRLSVWKAGPVRAALRDLASTPPIAPVRPKRKRSEGEST
jgi:predicted DNA-binding transcriptional regulator AlpA